MEKTGAVEISLYVLWYVFLWCMLLNLVHLAIAHLNLCLVCAIFYLFVNVQFQKISVLPPQKGIEFMKGEGAGGSPRTKNSREAGGFEIFPYMREIWIFSGAM